MIGGGKDEVFSGSIPKIYEQYLVPMLFVPYADDLAERVAARSPLQVLEIAAGTGAVTRAMDRALPTEVAIVATDLNEPMLHQASMLRTARPIEWRQADAMALPFKDASFDAVVCQFGAMFFPDRARAFSEARRVLRPGGALLFNVWDRLSANEIAWEISKSVASLFPDDPPRFLERTPYGYFERPALERDVVAGGFGGVSECVTLARRCRSESARHAAIAFCQGTPLRSEIEERDARGLDRTTEHAAAVLAERFGDGEIDTLMSAILIAATR